MSLAMAIAQAYPDAVLSPVPGPNHVIVSGSRISYWGLATTQPNEIDLLNAFDAGLYANQQRWAVQAADRKYRAAQAALAEPDSSDPEILRRKLNAALHLLNAR